MSGADDREHFDELARLLAEGPGLATLRLLQMVAALPTFGAEAPPPESPSAHGPLPGRTTAEPRPIGPWRPKRDADGAWSFVRGETPAHDDPWAPTAVLRERAPTGVTRVVFLGESAAAGFLYAPTLTPARILEAALNAHGRFEVVDLCRIDLSATALVSLTREALQLHPDILVVFAGNNWPVRHHTHPPPGHLQPVEVALAFRERGLRGLRELADGATERLARSVTAQLGHLAREAHVPLVVVVPEVDLATWERARPVGWLAGDKTNEWHRAHADAVAALEGGDGEKALAEADRMTGLDSGSCATTARLRATALRQLGRTEEAREAARAEVDARAWDNEPTVPGATTKVQDALRSGALAAGAGLVDLPLVFRDAPFAPSPHGLFLDYCHLTREGMARAMAAVASAVLERSGRPAPGPKELLAGSRAAASVSDTEEAQVLVLAGLYNAHWRSPAGGNADPSASFMSAALQSSAETRSILEAYVETRGAPADALLFSIAQQRFRREAGRLLDLVWNVPGIDPEGLEAIGTALGPGAGARVAELLLAHHRAEHGVDLLETTYLMGNPTERAESRYFGRGTSAMRRALWPETHVCLVATGSRDLTLELTARLPSASGTRTGNATILVNRQAVGQAALGPGFTRSATTLPAPAIRRGLNRLTIRWPSLLPEGELALRQVEERMELGRGAEWHPVFGEIFACWARG